MRKDIMVSVPMSKELALKARVLAAKQNISRSELMRRALKIIIDMSEEELLEWYNSYFTK